MFTPPMIIGCGSFLLYIVFDILGGANRTV